MFPTAPFGSAATIFNAFRYMVKSATSCFFRRKRERPATTLRGLCVTAYDFMARTCGQRLDREQRRALSCLLDLGALINDHFDQHHFCKRSYRKLRKDIAANQNACAVYRVYFRELCRTERSRPRPWPSYHASIPEEVANYRERVVRLSLSALATIAFGRPNADDNVRERGFSAEDACIHFLFPLVMLIQICDDILDWRKDWHAGLPTFVTAELLRNAGQANGNGTNSWPAPTSVERMAATYLAAAPRWRCTFWPLASCTYAAFFIIKLLSSLFLRVRAGREAIERAGFGALQVGP
jgi:hypothetical protein